MWSGGANLGVPRCCMACTKVAWVQVHGLPWSGASTVSARVNVGVATQLGTPWPVLAASGVAGSLCEPI